MNFSTALLYHTILEPAINSTVANSDLREHSFQRSRWNDSRALHSSLDFWHRRHVGRVSSHFIRRDLHVKQLSNHTTTISQPSSAQLRQINQSRKALSIKQSSYPDLLFAWKTFFLPVLAFMSVGLSVYCSSAPKQVKSEYWYI